MIQLTDEQLIAELRSHAELSSPGPMMSTVRGHIAWVAADAFENTVAELAKARTEIERLQRALREIERDCEADYPPSHGAIKYACRAALAPETKP